MTWKRHGIGKASQTPPLTSMVTAKSHNVTTFSPNISIKTRMGSSIPKSLPQPGKPSKKAMNQSSYLVLKPLAIQLRITLSSQNLSTRSDMNWKYRITWTTSGCYRRRASHLLEKILHLSLTLRFLPLKNQARWLENSSRAPRCSKRGKWEIYAYWITKQRSTSLRHSKWCKISNKLILPQTLQPKSNNRASKLKGSEMVTRSSIGIR